MASASTKDKSANLASRVISAVRKVIFPYTGSVPAAPPTRSYAPPPGSDPVPAGKYICPDPNCGYTWYRHSVSDPVPDCPHGHGSLQPFRGR
jgi:hypothetical protein